MSTILLGASALVAMLMAWAIGAQDVSNALGTAVGSRAVTVRTAILIGGIFEFLGSLMGGEVAHTISKGIVPPEAMDSPSAYMQLMFSTLSGAFTWLAIATMYSLPVSTSHSLVGSLVGITVMMGAGHAIDGYVLLKVLLSWVTSPLMGGAISHLLFRQIYKNVLTHTSPDRQASKLLPYLWGFTIGILSSFMLLSGPRQLRSAAPEALLAGLAVAAAVTLIVDWRNRRAMLRASSKREGEGAEGEIEPLYIEEGNGGTAVETAEAAFTPLMILTACVVAFSHGSNDVSNSIGPFAAVVEVYRFGDAYQSQPVPLWILMCGGLGIVAGLATYGYKVMDTIGDKIIKLTHSRGFCAQVGTALTVLTASILGLSVSTTHCLIGAISGIAMVEGIGKLNLRTLRKIGVSWLVTVPAAAFFGIIVQSLVQLVA